MSADLKTERDALRAALEALVLRCDGEEGVRADGSNLDTAAAHAVLMETCAHEWMSNDEGDAENGPPQKVFVWCSLCGKEG